ncbi:MAG: hypothetical protein KDD65_08745 [Bacteroidetes bacterium]|nr:hypothetical protein [Bacteroidota bacterium]
MALRSREALAQHPSYRPPLPKLEAFTRIGNAMVDNAVAARATLEEPV